MCIYNVSLEGMTFKCFHGCREDEKINGNIFKVDFEGRVKSDCAECDDLDETVDYGRIYRLIASVMNGERRNLLETLAHDIVLTLLEEEPQLERVAITVWKKNPPVAGPCDWAKVTLTGKRYVKCPMEDDDKDTCSK